MSTTMQTTAADAAIETFDRLVRAHVATGLDRFAAVERAAVAHPELHQAYMQATQPRRGSSPSALPAAEVVARFNAAVDEQRGRGADREDAILAVAMNDPALHAAYIEATGRRGH